MVERAQNLLSNEGREGSNPTGVVINGIGHFSVHGLSVLKQFSFISETKRKVISEAQWLLQVTSSPGELTLLQNILWNSPTRIPLLRSGQKVIDIISFSDLVRKGISTALLLMCTLANSLRRLTFKEGMRHCFCRLIFFSGCKLMIGHLNYHS